MILIALSCQSNGAGGYPSTTIDAFVHGFTTSFQNDAAPLHFLKILTLYLVVHICRFQPRSAKVGAMASCLSGTCRSPRYCYEGIRVHFGPPSSTYCLETSWFWEATEYSILLSISPLLPCRIARHENVARVFFRIFITIKLVWCRSPYPRLKERINAEKGNPRRTCFATR